MLRFFFLCKSGIRVASECQRNCFFLKKILNIEISVEKVTFLCGVLGLYHLFKEDQVVACQIIILTIIIIITIII